MRILITRDLPQQHLKTRSQFSARAGDLLDKWAKNCSTGKDWRELIGTEQVISTMPHHVQAWVRDKKPKTMVEAGKLADDYVRNRKFEYGAGNRQFRRNDDRPGVRDKDRAGKEKREEKCVVTSVSRESNGTSVSRESNGTSYSNHNKNSPKVLTKRKGHSASIVRSGGMYLHSAQIKQKMLTKVGNGTKEKTQEE